MFLSDLSIKQPVFATMMMVALAVLGITSYRQLKVDMFPNVEFPIVTVTTVYPGASPETVEREVTKRIEESINTVQGIKHVESTSQEGLSNIVVLFNLEVSTQVASQDIRGKVAGLKILGRGELCWLVMPKTYASAMSSQITHDLEKSFTRSGFTTRKYHAWYSSHSHEPIAPRCSNIFRASSNFSDKLARQTSPGPITKGTLEFRIACTAKTSFAILNSLPPCSFVKPIWTTRIRSTIEGSIRIADATSVAAPIIRTVSRFSFEYLRDVLIRKSTAGLRLAVTAFSNGSLPPSINGGCLRIPIRFSTTSTRIR